MTGAPYVKVHVPCLHCGATFAWCTVSRWIPSGGRERCCGSCLHTRLETEAETRARGVS